MIEEASLLREEQEEEREICFATVDSITPNGITLILDGEDQSGGKVYKANACATFQVGDRVKVHRDSGTLVVEFPIGAPGSRVGSTSKLAYSDSVAVEIDQYGWIKSINATQPSLGTSAKRFKNLYTKNGVLDLNATKLGFFGTDPIAKQTLSNSATLAQVIAALKAYGLFT